MSLEGVIDSKFEGINVAQVRVMVFAKPAKESSFDLIHRRSLFVNINICGAEMSQDWLFQCPQSKQGGHGNPECKLDTAIGRSVDKMGFEIIHRRRLTHLS